MASLLKKSRQIIIRVITKITNKFLPARLKSFCNICSSNISNQLSKQQLTKQILFSYQQQ